MALMGEDKRASKLAHGDAEVSSQAKRPARFAPTRGAMGFARHRARESDRLPLRAR